jgi:hypothetical protein
MSSQFNYNLSKDSTSKFGRRSHQLASIPRKICGFLAFINVGANNYEKSEG